MTETNHGDGSGDEVDLWLRHSRGSTARRRGAVVSAVTPRNRNHSNQPAESAGLTIRVSAGTGSGRTSLSAFDAALRSAGVGDFNLIRLSSVIPQGSRVIQVEGTNQLNGSHGDALFCVYAEAFAGTPREQAWAGVAWSWRDDDSGEGLFVEHSGPTEAAVERDLVISLADLCARRGGGFVDGGLLTASAECVDSPVCAIVIATYKNLPWSGHVC